MPAAEASRPRRSVSPSRGRSTGLHLARLDLGADTRNAASLRVAAKSGFRREGTLHGLVRRGEERSDDAIYSLLPTDPRGGTELE